MTSRPRSFLASSLKNAGTQQIVLAPLGCDCLNAWILLRSSRGPWPGSSKGKSMTSFQSPPSSFSRDESASSRMLRKMTTHERRVFFHLKLVRLLELSLALARRPARRASGARG